MKTAARNTEVLQTLKEAGVTKISIGIQSFSDQVSVSFSLYNTYQMNLNALVLYHIPYYESFYDAYDHIPHLYYE